MFDASRRLERLLGAVCVRVHAADRAHAGDGRVRSRPHATTRYAHCERALELAQHAGRRCASRVGPPRARQKARARPSTARTRPRACRAARHARGRAACARRRRRAVVQVRSPMRARSRDAGARARPSRCATIAIGTSGRSITPGVRSGSRTCAASGCLRSSSIVPEREIHALDLARERDGDAPAGVAIDLGDAGAVIDLRARNAYKARIDSLRDELAEAESWSDTARATRIRGELDALTQQMAAAVGLGGRERRSGSAVERARITVQRRIREAIRKIAEHDPDLGRHLDCGRSAPGRSVRTSPRAAKARADRRLTGLFRLPPPEHRSGASERLSCHDERTVPRRRRGDELCRRERKSTRR